MKKLLLFKNNVKVLNEFSIVLDIKVHPQKERLMTALFRVRTSSEIQKSRAFQGCFTVFSRAFPRFLEVQNKNNIHNEL